MQFIFNKNKKYNILPKTLLYRFLMIIIIPVLVAQLIAVYLFYQRHWYNVTQQTSHLLIKEVIELVESEDYKNYPFKNMSFFNLKYNFLPNHELPINESNNLKELRIFKKSLKRKLDTTQISIFNINNSINLYIKVKNDLLQIELPYKTLFNPTTVVFVIWMVVLTFLLLIISIIFSKNQIKSIIDLTNAVENFGINKKDKKYKPSGATEIRQAGIAFLKMQERIKKQTAKRTQMLAMISHDLKTPLTRMKLQVELLEEGEEKEELQHDVDSMQHMIASYLDFSKGEGGEQFASYNISSWIKEFFDKNFQQENIVLNLKNKKIITQIKERSLERAISNLITNALKFSTKIKISSYPEENNYIITIEDNGKGISKEERSLVFKPFYRADKSRSLESPSVGLGLAITKEIITGHYGTISLEDSVELKGLLVRIILPITKT